MTGLFCISVVVYLALTLISVSGFSVGKKTIAARFSSPIFRTAGPASNVKSSLGLFSTDTQKLVEDLDAKKAAAAAAGTVQPPIASEPIGTVVGFVDSAVDTGVEEEGSVGGLGGITIAS
jgi:hypothetical protein